MKHLIEITFFLLIFLTTSISQWQINGVPVCDTIISGGQALQPQIAPDGAGGAYVAWRDARNGSDLDIYAQHIDSAGRMLWQRNGISVVQAPYNQNFPQLCSDGEGGVFIAWEDDRSLVQTHVYVQRYNKDGIALWDSNGVKAEDNGGLFIRLDTDDKGGVVIAWSTVYNVRVQRLDSIGHRMWGDSGIVMMDFKSSIPPGDVAVVSDGRGGAIVSWISPRSDTASTWAQRIDSSGKVRWTTNGVSLSGTAKYNRMAIASVGDTKGGAFVTWSTSSNSGVYLQRIDSTGKILLPDTGLYVAYGGTAGNMVTDGKGGAITISGSTKPDFIFHRVSDTGIKVFGHGVNVSTTLQGVMEIVLSSDGESGGFIVWSKIDSNELNIYGQWIDSGGTVRYGQDGLSICNASSYQDYPVITNTGKGTAVTVWNDARHTDTTSYWAIYAAKLSKNGVVSVQDRKDFQPEGFELYQNYPNPFNPQTTIRFKNPYRTNIRIVITNLLGQNIATIENNWYDAGTHSVTWDSENVPTGVYFYSLITRQFTVTKKMVIIH